MLVVALVFFQVAPAVEPKRGDEAGSMPVAAEEKAPPRPPPPAGAFDDPERGIGIMAVGGFGLGILRTDLGASKEGTTGGGLFFDLAGTGFKEGFGASARIGGLFGGGSGGQESMFRAHLFLGGGAALGNFTQVFARIGGEGKSLKNDEIEASIVTVPALQLGIQRWADRFGFEIAPRIGLTARTEYEPGDESLGRRHWRRLGMRAGAGGSASLSVADAAYAEASYTRVIDDPHPVDVFDGRACLARYFALCAFGQYWRSVATTPAGGASAIDVPTFYVGGAIGIGITQSGAKKSWW